MSKASDFDEKSRKILHGTRLPIMTLDERWIKMFPNDRKSQAVAKAEDALNNELKLQARNTTTIKDLKALKKKLMSEIVVNMKETDGANEVRRQKKLTKSQQLIEDINDKLEKALDEELEYPERIRQANENLIMIGVKEMYKQFYDNKVYLTELNKWIDETRIEIKKRLLAKQEKEETNTNIYTFMHDMLGKDFMEVYDDFSSKK